MKITLVALSEVTKKIIILFTVLSFVFFADQAYGQFTSPPEGATPENYNTPSPINTGTTAQEKEGEFTATKLGVESGVPSVDDISITTDYPTLKFADNDHIDWWTHVNSNVYYLIADRNDDSNWAGEAPFPMVIYPDLDPSGGYADVVDFSNQVRANSYCNRSGTNCWDASSGPVGIGNNVRTGMTSVPAGWNAGSMWVYFGTTMSAVPTVSTALSGIQYWNACTSDHFDYIVWPSQVSQTAFVLNWSGAGQCGGPNGWRPTSVSWTAVVQ